MTQPAPQSAARPTEPTTIPLGATVYGQDNIRFGQVAGSYRDVLIVERGFFMPVDYYVPLRAVRHVEGNVVMLAVTRDAALTQGWDKAPFTAETGPRRARRPAVSGRDPVAASGSPAPSDGVPRAADRPRTDWPAAPASGTGPASAGEQTLDRPAPLVAADSGDQAQTSGTPNPATGGSAPLFADAYAIGVNTDSYQALGHHPASEGATPGPDPAGSGPDAVQEPGSAPESVAEESRAGTLEDGAGSGQAAADDTARSTRTTTEN